MLSTLGASSSEPPNDGADRRRRRPADALASDTVSSSSAWWDVVGELERDVVDVWGLLDVDGDMTAVVILEGSFKLIPVFCSSER
jgi:hypothetical protein